MNVTRVPSPAATTMACSIAAVGPTTRRVEHRPGRRCHDVGRGAALDQSDIERRRAEHRIHRQGDRADAVQRVEQAVDCRYPEFGVSGVCGHAGRLEYDLERPLLRGHEPVVGRLAIDQEAAFGLQRRGRARAVGPVLLANDEEQPDAPVAVDREFFRRSDHRGRDSLCIAGAASMDEFVVFAEREMRRHRVEVGREDQFRGAVVGKDVVAAGRHRLADYGPTALSQPGSQENRRRRLRAGWETESPPARA